MIIFYFKHCMLKDIKINKQILVTRYKDYQLYMHLDLECFHSQG